jgi:hypothetical protein
MHAGGAAVHDEPGPRNHHCFTNRHRICCTRQSQCVRASQSGRRITRGKYTKLQFTDRDDRKLYTFR